jgi:hypothetical protein
MEAPFKGKGPVGELKKVVSLVDRTDFDEFVYSKTEEQTVFQPEVKPYHNFIQESVVWTFQGGPAWGQRITFSVPWPWQGDFLNWIALRLKPASWLTPEAYAHMGPDYLDWVPTDQNDFWIWANSLGTAAIAKAEMEVDGITIEEFSGDWMNVWNKAAHTASRASGYDDSMYASYAQQTIQNYHASDDGYIYCYLPFWFSKFINTAFPLASCSGPDTIRFHITLRPFHEVVRKLNAPVSCGQTPINDIFQIRDYTYPFRKFTDVQNLPVVPGFDVADILCGISSIDGTLREAFVSKPHEILMNPVVETVFNEPLKYLVNTTGGDTIKIQLPLREANGPIRQIYFFLRRKVNVESWRDYNNYSAIISAEADPVWNPYRPLLLRAQLQVGTAIWADEEERWWRAAGDILLPGGVRAYGNYIYCYNFAEKPAEFSPSGSLNSSRADMRLLLTVAPPGGASDLEWSVHVFYVGTNWIRFQNGLANPVFMD